MNDLPTTNDLELNISRLVDVPAEKLYRCWVEPELLKQWFAPKPWSIASTEMNTKAGGKCKTVMKSPEGEEYPNEGVFLEVVPNKKIVMTDAIKEGWIPGPQNFMIAHVTFEPENSQTRYTARAYHWNKESMEQHVQMGFHKGWHTCLDQLVDLAKTI